VPVSTPELTAAQTAALQLIDDARLFMQDDPGLNVLLGGQIEFQTRLVEMTTRMVLARYNRIEPRHIVATTLDDIPLDLRIIGVCGFLLKAAMHLQARNQVSLSSDDDEAVGLFDKAPLYNQMAEGHLQDFDRSVAQYKMQRNINGVSGQLGSGYLLGLGIGRRLV
jgi:hypothetical protein